LNTLSFRRSRVQIAAPIAAVCAVLLLGLWIRVADAQQQQLAQQQQDVVLVPHRATYDMKLSVARPNSGIIEVSGRMVLEMVDSCEAWEVKQRIKLKFLRNDGEEFDTDSSFTSYETKDGLGLRFSVRKIQDQEVEEELRGHADLEATGGKGRASFSLPEVRSFELPAGTLFPTTHLALIIRHARDGDKSVSYSVFDGARLDGAFTVNAVIGKPPRGAGAPVVRGDVGLLRQQSWGVRLAFFAAGDQGTANPEYELALDLLANGIARSMLLDYGDFAVDARLVQIQALPRPRC
jgi:EipB-like